MLERSKTVLERIYGPAHPDTIGATFALAATLRQSAPDTADFMLRQVL